MDALHTTQLETGQPFRLKEWDIVRSGPGLTVRGRDETTSEVHRYANVRRIALTNGKIVCFDADNLTVGYLV